MQNVGEGGRFISNFNDLVGLGENHFQDIFRNAEGVSIAKIIWVT